MSIATERAALFAQGLDIVTRETWDAQQSYTSPRPVERARWLFLHIAVVDDPNDLVGTEQQVMRNIERIGQVRFGIGCSYNAAAFDTGRLYEAQPLQRRGAHTVNDLPNRDFPYYPDRPRSLNHLVRALVLPQQVDDEVTDQQIDAAARWGAALCRAGFAVPRAPWFGHRDVTRKSCPGPIAYERLAELNQLTRRYEALGLTDTPPTTTGDDFMAALTDDEQRELLEGIRLLTPFAMERINRSGEIVPLGTPFSERADPTVRWTIEAAANSRKIVAELAGLKSAISQLGAGGDIDYGKVQTAAEEAVKNALREGIGE